MGFENTLNVPLNITHKYIFHQNVNTVFVGEKGIAGEAGVVSGRGLL